MELSSHPDKTSKNRSMEISTAIYTQNPTFRSAIEKKTFRLFDCLEKMRCTGRAGS